VKRKTSRIVLIEGLLILLLAISACVPKNEEKAPENSPVPTNTATATPTPEPTATITNTPTPVPTATPTAIPTARPLVEGNPDAEPGSYVNDSLGLKLDYPENWEVLLNEQSGVELFMALDPDNPLFTYVTSHILEEDISLEDDLITFMEFMGENLELSNLNNIEIDSAYPLDNGLVVWRGVMRSNEGSGVFISELIAIERAGRVFTLWFMGWEEMHEYHSEIADEIRNSFAIYSPTPYGVARENAFFIPGSEPQTFDPALYLSSADSYIGDIFSGLVRLDHNLQPIPDLAERWEVSSDGLVYTFYLRQNAAFHTGRPFTAEDVLFSWNRAVDPDLQSPTAGTYLTDIVGVQAVLNGEAEEISGVKMIDEYTIEVTLDEPKAYFLHKLSYPTSWIVDHETIDDVDDNPVGTGPFKFAKHDENEIIILARNENYHLGFVPLEYVVYLLYQGPNIRLYEGGLIDMVVIDEELLGRAEDTSDPLYGNIQPYSRLCTTMMQFDSSIPPFDDVLVREAFARSIDRDRYNTVVAEGKYVVANGLYPTGLPGYNPDVTALSYDPERALEAIAESSYGSVDALPEIVYTASGTGGGLHPSDAVLIEMWQEVLGVTVTVEQIDARSYIEKINEGEHGNIFGFSWCADYPDPENFADVNFHSEATMNSSSYSNPEIDVLLEQARSEPDVTKRISLYQEIEQMLIDDAAAIFLIHSRTYYMVTKPYINNYHATPIGIAQYMNIWIEP
jgi:oligopeptide transport system substrate-binding protein